MDTKIAMVRRAVQTEIYSKWNRCPRWVVLSTVKADLQVSINYMNIDYTAKEHTLLAGFVLNFSKIFWD